MIPLATTTITVLRATGTADPYEMPADASEVISGVRAHISTPNGRGRNVGGQQQVIELVLTCDPCDLRHTDQVRDDQTSEVFTVTWLKHRYALGLDHITAGVSIVEGAA